MHLYYWQGCLKGCRGRDDAISYFLNTQYSFTFPDDIALRDALNKLKLKISPLRKGYNEVFFYFFPIFVEGR
jgi:hypothetical protein